MGGILKRTTLDKVLLAFRFPALFTQTGDWFKRRLSNVSAQTNRLQLKYSKMYMSKNLQAVVNGIIGDTLVAAHHPLAIQMTLNIRGQTLILEQHLLKISIPKIQSKLVVLVHGICMSDDHWPEDLFVPQDAISVSLHYNTGRHISTNGQELSALLEKLVSHWPVPVTDIVLIGSSLGGLVSRSASYYGALAGHGWLQLLSRLVFIGTPHHGSPLERRGNWVDTRLSSNRYTAYLARLGKMRSAGITDLRYGYLLDSDWYGRDRFEPLADNRQPVALPDGVVCYALAATMGKRAGDLSDRFMGDGLVPLESALGYHHRKEICLSFHQMHQWIGFGMHHMELLNHPMMYDQIKSWLASPIT